MMLSDFIAAVEARGYTVPAGATGKHGGYDNWLTFLSFPRGTPGAPGHRVYTQRHVDLVVAWQRILEVTGAPVGAYAHLHRRAARLLAGAALGYVFISGGNVGWSPTPPLEEMRHGATVWPVVDKPYNRSVR